MKDVLIKDRHSVVQQFLKFQLETLRPTGMVLKKIGKHIRNLWKLNELLFYNIKQQTALHVYHLNNLNIYRRFYLTVFTMQNN